MEFGRGPGGRRLAAYAGELRALLTQRLSAGALDQILIDDADAKVAVGVVVVDRILARMPRARSRHRPPSRAHAYAARCRNVNLVGGRGATSVWVLWAPTALGCAGARSVGAEIGGRK